MTAPGTAPRRMNRRSSRRRCQVPSRSSSGGSSSPIHSSWAGVRPARIRQDDDPDQHGGGDPQRLPADGEVAEVHVRVEVEDDHPEDARVHLSQPSAPWTTHPAATVASTRIPSAPLAQASRATAVGSPAEDHEVGARANLQSPGCVIAEGRGSRGRPRVQRFRGGSAASCRSAARTPASGAPGNDRPIAREDDGDPGPQEARQREEASGTLLAEAGAVGRPGPREELRLHDGRCARDGQAGDEVVVEEHRVLDPVGHARGRRGGGAGVEDSHDGGVADRMRCAGPAGRGRATDPLRESGGVVDGPARVGGIVVGVAQQCGTDGLARDPYDDAPHAGGPVHDPAALAERIRRAATPAGPAQFDRRRRRRGCPRRLRRRPAPAGMAHRIDHAMLLDDDLVTRLAASGTTAVAAGVPRVGRADRPRPPRRGACRTPPPVVAPPGGRDPRRLLERSAGRSRCPAGWRARGAPARRRALRRGSVARVDGRAAAATLGDDAAGRWRSARAPTSSSSRGTRPPSRAMVRASGADGIRVEATVAAGRVVHGALGWER